MRDSFQDFALRTLMEEACPSIKYRIRAEILNESTSSSEMKSLQQEILHDNAVQNILSSQARDGWLGQRFHGYDSLESSVRFLIEKGIHPKHPAVVKALDAMEKNQTRIEQEIGRVGHALDEQGLGGLLMMQATVYAYAGVEKKTIVQDQISKALEGFDAPLNTNSMDEITDQYKTRLIFKPKVKWISIYHFRLLAFTHGWRTPGNQKTLTNAVKRLIQLSPLPDIKVRRGSQLIAPAAFGMLDFNPKLDTMKAAEWMPWFHRMELLARLGVIREIPELLKQMNILDEMLNPQSILASKHLIHDYFKHWGAYTGLMLENDWKVHCRRYYDLAFRALLIRHYARL